MSEVQVTRAPGKAQWYISSAAPWLPFSKGSYMATFGVRPMVRTVWTMLEPMAPAEPRMAILSSVR